MDDRHPKRRKDKYNPYTLSLVDGKCYLSFKDGQGFPHKLELDVKLYALFDRFELDDLSFLNEQERHLDQTGTELLQVAKKSFEEQSSHFGQFLYWLVEGRHITDNRTAKTGNGTCNAYLKDVFGFFLYLADNGYTEPLRVLAYNQITVSNAVGVKRTIRSKSFKGYLKEKDRNVRAAQEPEIIDILRACTNLRISCCSCCWQRPDFGSARSWVWIIPRISIMRSRSSRCTSGDDNDNEARAKNAEYRSAKISRETFEFLLHYLAEYRRLLQRQSLLFINIRGETAGKPMRVESVYDMLDRMEEKNRH